jgi:hypothetical protein
MQCFQKDPNLRVSAKKLLRHAWIVGSRRTDAPVAKPPANFSDAVEEVKQWNEALKSPTGAGSFRASTRSNVASPGPPKRDPPLRNIHNDQQGPGLITPAKGPLSLAKPKNTAEAFRSPECIGKWKSAVAKNDKIDFPSQEMTIGMMISFLQYHLVPYICLSSSPMTTLEVCCPQIV